MFHAHVALRATSSAGDMAEPCADQHQGGVAVWESANDAGSRRISRFSRSMTLIVRIFCQWAQGEVHVDQGGPWHLVVEIPVKKVGDIRFITLDSMDAVLLSGIGRHKPALP
jgi:hypothetical protein